MLNIEGAERAMAPNDLIVSKTNLKGRLTDHYRVLVHVAPSPDSAGRAAGRHSNRRKPDARALGRIKTLYETLLAEETRHANRKEGLVASTAPFQNFLNDKGTDYDEYVLSL